MSFLRPVSDGWWFVKAYILLALCAPLINTLVRSFSKRGFQFFIFFVWAFYYSISYVFGDEYQGLIRAFFFYILGSFIRLHLPRGKFGFKKNAALVLICIILYAAMGAAEFLQPKNLSSENYVSVSEAVLNRLFEIIKSCIGAPVFSFCFFRIFENLDIGFCPKINKISSATFGVYLIHDNSFSRSFIWNAIFSVSSRQLFSPLFPVAAVLDIAAVFSVCVLIDLLRKKFFEPFYTRLFEKFEVKLKGLLFMKKIENQAQ